MFGFDAGGCGETSKPPAGSRMSFGQLAGDAIGLMEKVDMGRVHWVGESSGGIVGMTAALTYPDRLSTLTLCDTPFKRSANIASTYVLGEANRAAAFDKYGVGGWCRQTLSYRIDTTKASPELCEWYIAEMDKTPKHAVLRREQRNPLLPEHHVAAISVIQQESFRRRHAPRRRIVDDLVVDVDIADADGFILLAHTPLFFALNVQSTFPTFLI